MNRSATRHVAIVGGGPAGLMAAEVLASRGVRVDLFDAMPSVGRKFLLAGKGGLNLTHGEDAESFIARYGEARAVLEPWMHRFGALQVRDWASGLGIETFVGSSGRVFPTEMKAAPLLRRWLHRLRDLGVRIHVRHRWVGFASPSATAQRPSGLRFSTPHGELLFASDAVLLAVGGGSWPALGSDGAWVPWLREAGVDVAALRPSNCGFDVAPRAATCAAATCAAAQGWSEHFRSRFAGVPVKGVRLRWVSPGGEPAEQVGEFVITETGVEGSLIYAASAGIREAIAAHGAATVTLDLLAQRSPESVVAALEQPRGSRSLSTHLKARLGFGGVRAALMYELLPRECLADSRALAAALKRLPLHLQAARPIEEAISSAGGVRFAEMDQRLMLRAMPGLFCAGEMLDWEAPTGGYLLTACLSTGVAAAEGLWEFLESE